MSIEERIELPADSRELSAAAEAAEALAHALADVEENAAKASKATGDAAKASKGALGGKGKGGKGGAADDAKAPDAKAPDAAAKSKKQLADDKKAIAETAKAEKKAASDQAKAQKTAISTSKKKAEEQYKATQKSREDVKGALGAIAGGAAIAVGAVVGLGGALKGLGDVKVTRDNIKAMLNELTGGRGDEAFEKLDGVAKSLGETTESVAGQFADFRKNGLDNINSVKLIKLKADLEAVGVSAPNVELALGRVTDQIKRGGDADGAIKQIAKRYGAVGDGANAAAKSAYTVEGAFNRLQRTLDETVGKLADAFGPTIIDLINTFETSIESISTDDINDAIDNTKAALELLKPAITGSVDAFKGFLDVYNEVGNTIRGKGKLFDGLKDSADSLKDALPEDAKAIDSITSALKRLNSVPAHPSDQGSLVGEFDLFKSKAPEWKKSIDSVTDSIGDAFSAIGDKISAGVDSAIDTLEGYVTKFEQVGKDFINGLISGVESDLTGISGATEKAAQAGLAGLKGKGGFDSHSPSKKTMKEGDNAVEGLIKPFEDLPRMRDLLPRGFFDGFGGPSRPENDNGGTVTHSGGRDSSGATVTGDTHGDRRIELHIHINGPVTQDTLDEVEERAESALRRALAS